MEQSDDFIIKSNGFVNSHRSCNICRRPICASATSTRRVVIGRDVTEQEYSRISSIVMFYTILSLALAILLTCASRNLQHVKAYLQALVQFSSC